jgi:hypothetical protein
MRTLLIRFLSSGLLAASLGVGLAHAASNTITDTGPHSNNQIISSNRSSVNETNTTNVNVANSNNQVVHSGNATVEGNTIGGYARSGDVSNSVVQSTNVSTPAPSPAPQMTSGFGGGSNTITDTGPHSNNQIISSSQSSFNETNTTNVTATNSNDQSVSSGSAVVRGNTIGGYARSSDVSNSVIQSTNVGVGASSWAGNGMASQPPVHSNPPVKPNTNLQGSNPWMPASEMQASRRDNHGNGKGFGNGRFVAVMVAHPCSQPCTPHVTKPPRPCPVVNFRTIRPPCHVVVAPPCQQHSCYVARHCHNHHHRVHHCVPQHQNHKVC